MVYHVSISLTPFSLLSAIFVATRFSKVLHSFPIPPCVENTNGTNVAFSILITRAFYALFLLLSLSAYRVSIDLLMYDGAHG